jgi:glycosyltransferase involved in cell wall biosynthesis
MKRKIAVLIPCYNECRTIEKVVLDFKKELPEAAVYVFDNNSTDGSDKVAEKAGAIVQYEHRQGKGNVIRQMFLTVDADCYLMVDGDDTYSAAQAKEMARLVLEKGYDMVIGDRLSSTYYTENKRIFHNTGNKLVKDLINRLFKSNIMDIMSGYRAFSYSFVKTFPVVSKGFEIETEMTIHALDKNMAWICVPVDYRDRPDGSESKLNTYRDGVKVLSKIFMLYKEYRPFSFFAIITLILLAIAVLFFIPVGVEYYQTGLVPKIPSLIASGIFLVLSLLSFVSGIILDSVAKDQRNLFEMLLSINHTLQKKDKRE